MRDVVAIVSPAKAFSVGVGSLLVVASVVGIVLSRIVTSAGGVVTVRNLNARVRAWWILAAIFAAALLLGRGGVCSMFGVMSFLALREVITLTPTRRGDHHTLFYAFFVAVPLQYILIYVRWYGLFIVLIPVYGFALISLRSALAGDARRYHERVAKTFWAVMICVFFLSHAAALMILDFGPRGTDHWELVAYLVIVVQLSDVLQYCWGKWLGKRKVAPRLSPGKTWEGLVGGVLSATLVGLLMTRLTPLTFLQSGVLSFVACACGFFGGLVASAVKRDAGVKDYGQLIEGHGGMMDRMDSLAFAAPIFFHLVRFWLDAN